MQPFLHLHEAYKMIPFMEAAFGAEAMGVHKSPEGMVMHATMRIGNATLEIDEATESIGQSPAICTSMYRTLTPPTHKRCEPGRLPLNRRPTSPMAIARRA